MKRRNFLQVSSGIALSPWFEPLVIAAGDRGVGTGVLDDRAKTDIRSLFESNNDEALTLTEDVFRKCILQKILSRPGMTESWICRSPNVCLHSDSKMIKLDQMSLD